MRNYSLATLKKQLERARRKFRKNENKYYMYQPLVGGEQVCAKCKEKEKGA